MFLLEAVASSEPNKCNNTSSHLNRRRSSSLTNLSQNSSAPHQCNELSTVSLQHQPRQTVCYLCKRKLKNEASGQAPRFFSRLLLSKSSREKKLPKCSSCENFACVKCSTFIQAEINPRKVGKFKTKHFFQIRSTWHNLKDQIWIKHDSIVIFLVALVADD